MTYPGEQPPTVPGQPQTPAQAVPVSPWAVLSFISGFVAMATIAFKDVGGLAAIVGIVAGHVGRRDIKAGLKTGDGWAIGGLILCYFLLIAGIVGRFMMARRS